MAASPNISNLFYFCLICFPRTGMEEFGDGAL